VNTEPKPASETVHDTTLIDWFLSLAPAERLAELESRVAFFNSAATRMTVGDLSILVLPLETLIEERKSLGRDKDRAVVRLLEAVAARCRGG
jgi:hypothetical protein